MKQKNKNIIKIKNIYKDLGNNQKEYYCLDNIYSELSIAGDPTIKHNARIQKYITQIIFFPLYL